VTTWACVNGTVITATLATLGCGAIAAGGLGMVGGLIVTGVFGLLGALICAFVVWAIWYYLGETGKHDDPTHDGVFNALVAAARIAAAEAAPFAATEAAEDPATSHSPEWDFHGCCEVCGYRQFAPSPVAQCIVFAGSVLNSVEFQFADATTEKFAAYSKNGGWPSTPFKVPLGEYITEVHVRDQDVSCTRGIKFVTNKGTESPAFGVMPFWNSGNWRALKVHQGRQVRGLQFDPDGTLETIKTEASPVAQAAAAATCTWCRDPTVAAFQQHVDRLVLSGFRTSSKLATDPDATDEDIKKAVQDLGNLGALAGVCQQLEKVDKDRPWYSFWCKLGDQGIYRIVRLMAAQLLLSKAGECSEDILEAASTHLSKAGMEAWGVPYCFILRDFLVGIQYALNNVTKRQDVADAQAFFGVLPCSPGSVINQQFHKLSRKFHPDKVRSETQKDSATILQAYLNEARRMLLDASSLFPVETMALTDGTTDLSNSENTEFFTVEGSEEPGSSADLDGQKRRMDEEKERSPLQWKDEIQVSRQRLKNAIDFHVSQKVAFRLMIRYRDIVEGNGQCFLPNTMCWISQSDGKSVEDIELGSQVLGIGGEPMTVIFKQVHEEAMHEIVTLKTRCGVSLSVTADHRVAVPDDEGGPTGEKRASQLRKGDLVFLGEHAVPLVKEVCPHWMRTAVVQLQFLPDLPVVTFHPPRWGLATYGQEAPFPDTEDGF